MNPPVTRPPPQRAGADAARGPGAALAPRPPVLVFGCGRDHHGADQIGLRIAEAPARRRPPATHVALSRAPRAALLLDLEGVGLLVVIDAAESVAELPVGSWTRIVYAGRGVGGRRRRAGPGRRAAVARARHRAAMNPHTLNVNCALELGRRLGLLPPTVWVYVVAGQNFELSDACTPAVLEDVEPIVASIRHDIVAWLAKYGGPPCTS